MLFWTLTLPVVCDRELEMIDVLWQEYVAITRITNNITSSHACFITCGPSVFFDQVSGDAAALAPLGVFRSHVGGP